MTTLYGNKVFFKEATKKSSNFTEDILKGLGRAVEQLPPDQKKIEKRSGSHEPQIRFTA